MKEEIELYYSNTYEKKSWSVLSCDKWTQRDLFPRTQPFIFTS
jgi:hypothetical protein